jgi:hypothetical protein
MKKLILALLVCAGFAINANAQLYSTSSGTIDFYSETPLENIEAHSKNVVAILSTKTRDVAIQVANTSFQFPNKLMQEHFNEKYMESEKYVKSSFAGKINEDIDFSKEGTYDVTVTGKLNIHGVPQDRTISGKIIVKGGTIQLISDFKVIVADHKIEIPTLVATKIAEEINVHLDVVLNPKK